MNCTPSNATEQAFWDTVFASAIAAGKTPVEAKDIARESLAQRRQSDPVT